jgi:signal transduction histidine kinase
MNDLLANLDASDPATLVRAVENAARRLRDGALSEQEALALGRALSAHVRHPRSTVRTALARAARYLPDAAFEEVARALREDADQYVARAAQRAVDERGKRRKVAAVREERSAGERSLQARLDDIGGEPAVRLALRLRDHALGQFVEALDHELVKVGTSLRLDLDELRRDARRVTGERLGAPADDAVAALDALLSIVQSARRQMQRAEPSFREEKLRALVDAHVALLRGRLDEGRRGRLSVEVAVDEAITIELDRTLFGQALTNLLQNAVEAYPAAGDGVIHVRVAAEERLTSCVVVVEDRGCGIPASRLERMGEPFVSSKGDGRGLGMANVRRNVTSAHGGTVEVRSQVGEGTTVVLELPRRQ